MNDQAAQALSWLSWWDDSDWVVRGVFVLLVGLSMLSWAVIAHKAWLFRRIGRHERRAAAELRRGGSTDFLHPDAPCRHLLALLAAPDMAGRDRAAIEARLSYVLRERRLALESGLTALATIGNSAPFIGLFGTVWGIMHALQSLGGVEAISMDLVAGPVAEALVATAAGLFTAIPAVAGYNLLLRRLRHISGHAEGNAIVLLERASAGGR